MQQHATHLTLAKRQLVQLMSRVDYGRIEGFAIREGEPVLEPPPRLVFELSIRDAERTSPRRTSGDFVLKDQVSQLFGLFTRMRNARVERLEVKAGLPQRVHLEPMELERGAVGG